MVFVDFWNTFWSRVFILDFSLDTRILVIELLVYGLSSPLWARLVFGLFRRVLRPCTLGVKSTVVISDVSGHPTNLLK